MNVLNLVTTKSSFFKLQIQAVENKGISVDSISVPGPPRERTKTHYIKFYANVLGNLSKKYDLIHANYGLTAPMALLQPVRPVVLTLWGCDLMGSYSPLSKNAARYCDEIIVMSDEMKSKLGQDAHVIPHGIDLNQFQPMDQTDAKASVGWDLDTKHVLFPYDPSRQIKNYPLAEQVVNAVQAELQSPVELQTVYGIDHNDIPTYMNAADALLLTSKREGSPNTVKEAMACNLPVVSTDVGDVQERLSGVTQSVVCQSESELIEALVSILKSGVQSNGREHVKDASLERMGEQIIEVYKRALS